MKLDRYGNPYTTTNGDHRIDASAETLMRQAKLTAGEYLDAAVLDIDEKFGSGFAKSHPELVAAYMTTAALDYGTVTNAQSIQDLDLRPDCHVRSVEARYGRSCQEAAACALRAAMPLRRRARL